MRGPGPIRESNLRFDLRVGEQLRIRPAAERKAGGRTVLAVSCLIMRQRAEERGPKGPLSQTNDCYDFFFSGGRITASMT